MWDRLRPLFAKPVDAGSLAMFRIGFGIVMLLEACTLLRPFHATSLIERYFTGPLVAWHFPYVGLAWLRPWPEPLLTWHVCLMALAAATLSIGLASRISAAVVFLTWTYLWLLDAALYNNHYYLMSLLAFLLAWMPAGSTLSIDAFWRKRRLREADGGKPRRRPFVPFWSIWLLRAQLAAVYFYGGVAKLNERWLEHAQPLRFIISGAGYQARVEQLLPLSVAAILKSAGFASFLSYAGLMFDLCVCPLLLIPRTRLLAFSLLIAFHGFNHLVLFENIGWFPILGIVSATIFLPPDWPRRLASVVGARAIRRPDLRWCASGAVVVTLLAAVLATPMEQGRWLLVATAIPLGTTLGWRIGSAREPTPPTRKLPLWATMLICGYVGLQFIVPLRHYALEGDVDWTAEGDRFAWRMKTVGGLLLPVTVRVEDDAIVPENSPGRQVIAWDRWRGHRVLYRQVDPLRFDWHKLPEFIVVFEPFCGERVLLNPYARRAQRRRASVTDIDRIREVWRTHYGRDPVVNRTQSGFDVLAKIEEDLKTLGAPQTMHRALAAARQAALLLESERLSAPALDHAATKLRRQIDVLTSHAVCGESIRAILRKGPPWMSLGAAPPPGPLLEIDDGELFRIDRRGYRRIDREQWSAAWPEAEVNLVNLTYFLDEQLASLPEVLLVQQRTGRLLILWNPAAELLPHQLRCLKSRPIMCHAYAAHVAGVWQRRYGRRPRVFFDRAKGLFPYAVQRDVDPTIDLAGTSRARLAHNGWILPLRRELGGADVARSRARAASTAGRARKVGQDSPVRRVPWR